MDKFKDICFAIFVKHLFWTLGGVILIMGIAAWFMSAGPLKEQYTQNKQKIDTTHATADQLKGTPQSQIFNTETHDGMEAENTRRAKEVYLAWREKYSRQRKDVLVWPDGLSRAFVRDIERILAGQPIEEVKITPQNDLITTRREEFRNRINALLPQLAEMIHADWNPGALTTGRGGRSGSRPGPRPPVFGGDGRGPMVRSGMGEEEEKPPAVLWESSDQNGLASEHFNFVDQTDPPTTIEILYAMEDYWVLKALMQIIARTNEGVLPNRRDLATIREIHTINIGRSVQANVGQVYRLQAADGDELGEVPGGRPAPGAQPGPPLTNEGGEFGATAAQVNQLAEGRYVDKKGDPLPADKLKTAASGQVPEDAYLAVAKRMPVRMRLKMDQRKLNKFLVECGNGDLMLEVEQVRINPDEPNVVDAVGGSSGSRRSSPFGGARINRPGVGGAEAGGGGDAEPWDVIVEVYGIIYIFNPPSIERLKLTVEDKEKLDAVDLDDASAAEAAAAAPSEGEPATSDSDDKTAPADDTTPADGATPAATDETEAAAAANPATGQPPPAG